LYNEEHDNTWHFNPIHDSITEADDFTDRSFHLECGDILASPPERVAGTISERHVTIFIHDQHITYNIRKGKSDINNINNRSKMLFLLLICILKKTVEWRLCLIDGIQIIWGKNRWLTQQIKNHLQIWLMILLWTGGGGIFKHQYIGNRENTFV